MSGWSEKQQPGNQHLSGIKLPRHFQPLLYLFSGEAWFSSDHEESKTG
jgi:hypothetical protein